ncbi:TetR family transcriptional regulator [Streptomyces sp. NBC_00377]|uniref:TetR/AcrR family transcriptional regulator n=1 Tax=unclassified Streptomyces TaxID=2593676 RepID=UPI002E1D2241|nr:MULTISPECIES: TetR family transcriptional regulator [unclassified Streptomyces]
MTPPTRLGRRPGETGTRETILEVARRKFAELGYDRTTMRSVAVEAEVDAALVSHFFGSKQQLFAAAAPLPFDPETVLAELLGGPRETIGRRLAAHVLGTVDTTDGRLKITGLIRAAASEEAAARVLRERVTQAMLVPLTEGLNVPQARLRAALAASQAVGLIMARDVIGLEVLAETETEILAGAVGHVLQHYLTGPLVL